MKLMKKLTPVALATSMAVAGMAAPGVASAELSASASVANFYLWRGLDISSGGAQVAGSLDYAHDSGLYAGVWTSSEDSDTDQSINPDTGEPYKATAGSETDLYIGYAGEAGGLSYDVSFWEYLYPSDNALTGTGSDLSDSDLSELIVGLGYADVGLTVYFGNDTGGGSDYEYITLDYTYGDFNILYGTWQFDEAGTPDGDAHLTLAYAATDNFTFTVSMGIQDDEATTIYDEDPLFHVSYTLPIDMK